MRTLGHRQAIEEQAGKAMEGNVFVDVMLRKTWTLLNSWFSNLPDLEFYTILPDVSEQFISGDSPVVVMQFNNNPIWVPADAPKAGIIDLTEILKPRTIDFGWLFHRM